MEQESTLIRGKQILYYISHDTKRGTYDPAHSDPRFSYIVG